MTGDQVWSLLLGPLGTLVLALLVIVGFIKGAIVPGYLYKALALERDRLFEIARPAVQAIEHAAKERREGGGLGS